MQRFASHKSVSVNDIGWRMAVLVCVGYKEAMADHDEDKLFSLKALCVVESFLQQ